MLGWFRISLVVVMVLSSAAGASPRTLVGHHPRWASPANDRGVVANRAIDHLSVRLVRSPEKQAAFSALLAAQQTPGSPYYHQWLTPAQIGQRFGASDADIAQVTSWLASSGFKVLGVGNSKTFVEIAGTTDIAAKAFGVEFHDYAVGGKTLMSIDREPTIPGKLASIVAGIHGLHQSDIRPQHVRGSGGHLQRGDHSLVVDGAGNHSVGPSDFSTIYNLGPAAATLKGTGQVIGIIGRSRVLPADVTNFGTAFGVTMPTPAVVIPPTGTDPGTPCGDTTCACMDPPDCTEVFPAFDDQEEATLDVLRAGSIALGATVELIVSTSDTMGDDGTDIALEYAIDNFGMGSTANIINLSFGTCEADDPSGQSDAMALDELYQQAAMQGQSVFVSAGDAAAAGCQPQGGAQDDTHSTAASVNILGSSSSVTCMGGTKFADSATQSTYWNGSGAAQSYIPEGAWNEGIYPTQNGTVYVQLGGGGGESLYIAKPTYQSNVGAANSLRLVPDVSFDSATIEGYVVCLAGIGADCAADTSFAFTTVGGTSAAAPDMSGVAALIDQSTGSNQGNLNPTLYMLGADSSNHVYNDVTVASSGVGTCDVDTPSLCNNSDPGPDGPSGGTVGYAVANGYDEATGWGSIDISQLIAHWPGATPIPMLSVNPTTLTVLEGQTGTAQLDATGFTGSPTFSCGGLPNNATCSFAGNTLTVTVSAVAAGVTDVGSRWRWLLLAVGFALLALSRGRQRTRGRRLGVITVFAITIASCGGSSNNNMPDAARLIDAGPPSTHTVTIAATSGSESAQATLSLTSN
ncbi:MAG TPA: S53 family peptidase [Kofleriaceae bacterium]|jgi:subtilase family serine protease